MAVKNILILLGLVLLCGGVWWLVRVPAAPLPEESTSVSDSADVYTESTDLYTIRIEYPVVSLPEIQEQVDEFVEAQVAWFKEESVSLIDDTEATRLRETGRRYELGVEYRPYTYRDFVSYVFNMYLDTGGAHPNAFYRTLVFDRAGQRVDLADLFVTGAAYLPRLSSEAYDRVVAELARRSGGALTPDMEEGARLGTAPTPEALQFFYLDTDGLHLLFPPYQVAAYAAGSFDIVIPLSELGDILKPEFN